jgi:Ca2+/H+ antiporter, TMEM165/GDT1 family
MDALLPVFVAILLGETGGRVQAVAHRLDETFNQIRAILAALACATIINLSLGAVGGAFVANLINFQARTLLAGLALIFAGAPMLLARKPVAAIGGTRPFGTSLVHFARAQLGDTSQFIVFGFAARTDMPVFALAGGLAAVMISTLPPLLLRDEWPGAVPLGLLRRIAAALLIIAGLQTALGAMQLI